MFDWVMIAPLSVTVTTNLFLSQNEDVDEIDLFTSSLLNHREIVLQTKRPKGTCTFYAQQKITITNRITTIRDSHRTFAQLLFVRAQFNICFFL